MLYGCAYAQNEQVEVDIFNVLDAYVPTPRLKLTLVSIRDVVLSLLWLMWRLTRGENEWQGMLDPKWDITPPWSGIL